MDTEILKEFGLIDNEIKVYLKLLKSGEVLASDVAEETKLHRTHVYDLLKSLIKKSLVTYVIKENRKYFQAIEPGKLKSLLMDKQEELKKSEIKLNSLIKELKNIKSDEKKDLVVSVYEGQRGFKALLEDIIKMGKNYYVLGYNPKAEESLQYFLPGFYKRRIKAKIKRKAIVDPKFKKGSWVKKQKMQEIKFFKYSFPMGIIIYGKRVVMTIIQEDNQIAIVIENKKIAENFIRLFEDIWKQSKK